MNKISKYIGDVYGSKRGLLRHAYFSILVRFSTVFRKNKILPANVSRVVFVCKGNICRSAVAEWSFKLDNNISCCSVGLDTTSGNGANDRIKVISKDYGISLDEHRTTDITDFLPLEGDLYICMEPQQVKQLEEKIGARPAILLGLFGEPKKAYIHDPYNANNVFADDCIKYITIAVKRFSSQLKMERYKH